MNERFYELKEKLMSEKILNLTELKSLLDKYIDITDNSKALYYVNSNIMPCKVGNKKIEKNTIIFNMNNSLNCYSSKMGYCNECDCCYSKKYQKVYPKSCLNGIASEINFHKLFPNEIIESIEEQNKNRLIKGKIEFIRINEAGDFKDYHDFEKANKIAKYFYDKYGIITYTYSHNKTLKEHIDYINDSYIVLNWSFKVDDKYKQSMVLNDTGKLKDYYNNPKYVICLGKCSKCSYCKDRNDKRTIVFINHYDKSIETQLEEILTEKEIEYLKEQKEKDYNKLKCLMN